MEGLRIRPATATDLADLAGLAAPLQAEPTRFQAYFGDDRHEIAAEIAAVPGWLEHTVVATRGGEVVGWLLAEHDDEIGRVWWWGPVVADRTAGDDGVTRWTEVADALLDTAEALLDGRFDELEFAVDARHEPAISAALRRGYHRETGSVLLELHADGDPHDPEDEPHDPDGAPVVIVADPAGRAGDVAALHDETFPAAHLTGRQVVESAADDVVLVALDRVDDRVVGYVRAEVQPGGDGYVDFLGVAPAARGCGIGGRLVVAAVRELRCRGAAGVSLTVREDNAPARALYRRLGFRGDRLLVPLRRGFSA